MRLSRPARLEERSWRQSSRRKWKSRDRLQWTGPELDRSAFGVASCHSCWECTVVPHLLPIIYMTSPCACSASGVAQSCPSWVWLNSQQVLILRHSTLASLSLRHHCHLSFQNSDLLILHKNLILGWNHNRLEKEWTEEFWLEFWNICSPVPVMNRQKH